MVNMDGYIKLTKEELKKEISKAFIHGQGSTLIMETGLVRNDLDGYVSSTMTRIIKEQKK